jgi:hypothetical protein
VKYDSFSLEIFIFTMFWIILIGFKSGQNEGSLSRGNPPELCQCNLQVLAKNVSPG